MDIVIGEKIALRDRFLCLAFDLSIQNGNLRQIIYTVMSENFKEKFAEFKFVICFIGNCPIFVSLRNGILNLCFDVSTETGNFYFDVGDLAVVLEEAFLMISILSTANSDPSAVTKMMDVLAGFSIQNVFLFHSLDLPRIETDFPYRVNVIEVVSDGEISPASITNALMNSWTHCYMSKCEKNLVDYMYSLIRNITSTFLKLAIKVSPGLEIAWASGAKTEKQMQCDNCEFTFSGYPSDLTVFFAMQPTSKFTSRQYFSVQIVYEFSNAFAVVANRCWAKSQNMDMWGDTWNVLNMASMFMKQQSAHALVRIQSKLKLQFGRKYNWDVSDIPKRIIQVDVVARIVALFEGLVINENSSLPVSVSREIMFQIMTHGPDYIGYMATCLMVLTGTEDHILFPPFVLVPADSRIAPKEIACTDNMLLTTIMLPGAKIREIQEHIKEILARVK